jgi:histidyl-tRNA synthetase
MFRYERPQKGRLREHFQLNLDIVGEAGELADAEITAAAVDMLRGFGLGSEDFVARISDRELIAGLLAMHGVRKDGLNAAFAALDKLDRESPEWVFDRLTAAGASEAGAQELLGLADLELGELLERVGDDERTREAGERLSRIFGHLSAFGLGEFVRFDPSLVRGLAYYTSTVFELWDRRGEFRAICGGGRYDRLLEAVGGPDMPALGFGMGDVVLSELLKARDLLPPEAGAVQDYVICVGEEQLSEALRIVHRLRDAGRRVVYDLARRSVGRQFKAANQAGAARAIIVGPEELAKGEVLVREMRTGEERSVSLAALTGEEG